MNDLETTRRIAEGDAVATEKFVRDHYASVYRLLRHLTRHREDAEDLTQQTFISAKSKIATFRGRSELKTWVHRIAFNEYGQWKRRKRHFFGLQSDHSVTDPSFEAFLAGEILLGALSQLPEKHRETFVLHEIDELTVTEVAQVMRVPAGTVKARLFYARRRLRSLLEDGQEAKRSEPQNATI